jgi:hypothetical protein
MNRLGLCAITGISSLAALACLADYRQSIRKADTPFKVADTLDCFVQQRFDKVDERFGLSRMVTLNGHQNVRLFPETDEEKRLLKAVIDSRRDYSVSFVHVARPPAILKATAKNFPQYTAERRTSDVVYSVRLDLGLAKSKSNMAAHAASKRDIGRLQQRVRDAANAETRATERAKRDVERLKRGDRIDYSLAGWSVALRPVAARAACVECHTRSKVGETLGVMVYAVSNTVIR